MALLPTTVKLAVGAVSVAVLIGLATTRYWIPDPMHLRRWRR